MSLNIYALNSAFNIVGLVYLWFTIILGSFKMVQLSTIIRLHMAIEIVQKSDISSVIVDVWFKEYNLSVSCAAYIYWSGTFTAKEGILTTLIFTRLSALA